MYNSDLSYLDDLKERYIFALTNKKLMDDYKQYTSSFSQGYITMKNTKSSYIWTTHTQEIDISKETNIFVERVYEWILGFYADYNINFDLYIGNIFQNHYNIEKNIYTPLIKESGEYFMHCSLNCPNNNTALEIRNITTTCNFCNIKNEINLILLGVILDDNERRNTNIDDIKEITISL